MNRGRSRLSGIHDRPALAGTRGDGLTGHRIVDAALEPVKTVARTRRKTSASVVGESIAECRAEAAKG